MGVGYLFREMERKTEMGRRWGKERGKGQEGDKNQHSLRGTIVAKIEVRFSTSFLVVSWVRFERRRVRACVRARMHSVQACIYDVTFHVTIKQPV